MIGLLPVPIFAGRPDFRLKCPASRRDPRRDAQCPVINWRDKSNLRENRLGSSVEVAKYAILCSAMVFRSLPLFDKCGASVKLCLRLIFDYLLIRSMHSAHRHISGVDGLLRCVVIVVVMMTFKFGIRWQQF